MSNTSILNLTDRALVRLSGADAEGLLQRLITTDMDDVSVGEAGYGALLTPQGKILLDFLVTRQADGFLFDIDRNQLDGFVKKMTLYRMRSDVIIEPLDDTVAVVFKEPDHGVRDPRATQLGWRIYGGNEQGATSDTAQLDYIARHIEAIVPQSGVDFVLGDTFPHDINMDCLGGLDFEKGCYVGQEVVSRMHHRGTARRRLVRVRGNEMLPASGASITAGGKVIGTLGAVSGLDALAQVRLDRLSDAQRAGHSIIVGEVELSIILPDYASFSLYQ